MLRTLAVVAALLAAGCSGTSPCQTLGEKLCACSGLTHDACKTQVESQLRAVEVNDGQCDAILDTCNDNKPGDVEFCTWITTDKGKTSCGISVPP